MSHEDEVARLRAEMDQARAAMAEVAGGTRSFFSALLDTGFDEGQALWLTSNWMVALVRNGSDEASDE